jgi:hypothetical protein
MRKAGGPPLAKWRQNVVPTVIAMAAEMGPDELTARDVAQQHGAAGPADLACPAQKVRADILFLVACDLQVRQTDAVTAHDGLRKRGARARVEAHLARMLAFDFDLSVRAWRRACSAQGWCWTREQYAVLWGDEEGPLGPIVKDLGAAVAAVWAVYAATLQDAFVMEWTLE